MGWVWPSGDGLQDRNGGYCRHARRMQFNAGFGQHPSQDTSRDTDGFLMRWLGKPQQMRRDQIGILLLAGSQQGQDVAFIMGGGRTTDRRDRQRPAATIIQGTEKDREGS